MKEITAWQDLHGRLHKTQRGAIEADFQTMLENAWGAMPCHNGRGDPAVVASILAADTYSSARQKMLEALVWFDGQITELNAQR